jgi:uncharacterized membrane protein
MTDKNDKLVVAYYQNIPTATGAAQEMMEWDEANDDIKLGAVAVMSYDPLQDELVTTEIGPRNTRKGALWGTAIGATLGILTGGIALIPGLIIGAGTGAALGALDRKDVVMSQGDGSAMLERLRNGAGAVAVMADDFEVGPVKLFLARLGGQVDDFTLPQETAAAVTAAAAAQADAARAVDASYDAGENGSMTLAAVSSLSEADAAALHAQGFDKPSTLLAQAATADGRSELAKAAGIDEEAILTAAKEMDLMRVDGVGLTYASLLLASGVETVPDLARRNAANLAAKMAEVNAVEQLAEDVPSEETVAGWVAQAGSLPRMISY